MPRLLAALALSAALLALPAEAALATHYDRYLAPTSRCGGSKQTDTRLATAEQERVMHCMHTYARKRAGRAAYSRSSLLASSSDAKSADMLRCQEFSHNACGRSLTYHFHRVGYTSGGCWGVGENIAWGSGPYGTVRSIMRGWLHSDAHRGAILSSRYREIGYGLRKGTFRGYRGAQIWTAHFGYRC
jgi:uncharacterized protein YkwD